MRSMMTLSKDYGRQYAQLKRRINALRIKLLYAAMTETTLLYAEILDNLAKDLDILYSDGRYFDEIEKRIKELE
jgi:hypothetical protein